MEFIVQNNTIWIYKCENVICFFLSLWIDHKTRHLTIVAEDEKNQTQKYFSVKAIR